MSPSVQRERIEHWATYKGVEIAEWHRDEDWSGGTHERPGLERAITRCLDGDTDGIVAANIDRFSRTTELGLRELRRLEAANARLAFVVEDIDTGSVYGKMIYTILLAVAEAFLANIKANWEVVKTRAVKRGAYISRTPWGYARNEDGTLSPHPERAPIVTEAFRRAAAESLQAAATYLQNAAPERTWTATKVRRLLSQRSYLGETRNGDLIQADTHEPLVSRAIWEAAQTTPVARRPRSAFLLSGLARCGTCGSSMVGSRGGKGQRTYRCSGKCERGAVITAAPFEEHVREHARTLLAGLSATIGQPDADSLALLERTLIEAEAELDAFAADLTARRVLGHRYHAHLEARAEAAERARAAYRERASKAHAQVALDAPDIVDDPQLLPLLLRDIFASIIVVPGRGLSIAQRVRFVPLDGDGTAGMTGPERTD